MIDVHPQIFDPESYNLKTISLTFLISLTLKEYSTDIALHFYNFIQLTINGLKKKKKIQINAEIVFFY